MTEKRQTRVIDSGPHPKHAQLSDVLADLAVNELGPDAAIPSERELMATYDVSRATVRKAIESLIADGLLHRIHGKGTFVARPRLESRLHLASFSQDMRRRGRDSAEDIQMAVEAMIARMQAAHAADLESHAAGRPAFQKLRMLKDVEAFLVQRRYQQDFIMSDGLTELSHWLEHYPDMSLPNVRLRGTVLRLLKASHASCSLCFETW